MSDSNYMKIFEGNFILVQRIVSRLEAIGIYPVIKDEARSGQLAGFAPLSPGLQEIHVNKEEVIKATVIVTEEKNKEFS